MGRKCIVTGKGPLSGNNRSHALNATRRKWNVNLQEKVVTLGNGQKVRVKLSARGHRTLRKLLAK